MDGVANLVVPGTIYPYLHLTARVMPSDGSFHPLPSCQMFPTGDVIFADIFHIGGGACNILRAAFLENPSGR